MDDNSNSISTADKRISRVMYVAMGIIAIAVIVFAYWSLQPRQVLEVRNNPFPVRTIREHPTADGVVILKVDVCKHQDVVGRTRTSFVSPSREVFLPVAEEKLPVGCLKDAKGNPAEVPVLIPHDLPGGEYKVKFSVRYQINPIKSVTEEFETKSFIVDETQQ